MEVVEEWRWWSEESGGMWRSAMKPGSPEEAGHLVRPAVLGGEELLQAGEGGQGRGGDGEVGQVPGGDGGEGVGEGI